MIFRASNLHFHDRSCPSLYFTPTNWYSSGHLMLNGYAQNYRYPYVMMMMIIIISSSIATTKTFDENIPQCQSAIPRMAANITSSHFITLIDHQCFVCMVSAGFLLYPRMGDISEPFLVPQNDHHF